MPSRANLNKGTKALGKLNPAVAWLNIKLSYQTCSLDSAVCSDRTGSGTHAGLARGPHPSTTMRLPKFAPPVWSGARSAAKGPPRLIDWSVIGSGMEIPDADGPLLQLIFKLLAVHL